MSRSPAHSFFSSPFSFVLVQKSAEQIATQNCTGVHLNGIIVVPQPTIPRRRVCQAYEEYLATRSGTLSGSSPHVHGQRGVTAYSYVSQYSAIFRLGSILFVRDAHIVSLSRDTPPLPATAMAGAERAVFIHESETYYRHRQRKRIIRRHTIILYYEFGILPLINFYQF